MRAKRVDANQNEIVEQAKELGISAQSLHTIGKGCPDAIFGYAGVNIFAEIKTDDGKLNEDQEIYHETWQGQICTIKNIDELITEFLSNSNGFMHIMGLMALFDKYREMKQNDILDETLS